MCKDDALYPPDECDGDFYMAKDEAANRRENAKNGCSSIDSSDRTACSQSVSSCAMSCPAE